MGFLTSELVSRLLAAGFVYGTLPQCNDEAKVSFLIEGNTVSRLKEFRRHRFFLPHCISAGLFNLQPFRTGTLTCVLKSTGAFRPVTRLVLLDSYRALYKAEVQTA